MDRGNPAGAGPGAGEDAGRAGTAQAAVTGSYIGAGGTRLFCQVWRPEQTPRAVVVNLHGLGDHSGLYPTLVEHLLARGFAVHAPDLRGNGQSPGQRGYISRWEVFRNDLHRFLAAVRAEQPDQPLFVLGNSLGGLIVLEYALHHPEGIRGVIAASPPLGRLGIPAPLLRLGRIMSRVAPRFALRTGFDLSGLARDPTVTATVLADPLFHRWGTARLSTEVAAAAARVQAGAPRFPLPVLVLHGAADRLVRPDGSRTFVANCGHPDRELREYPEGYHVLFADLERERVLEDLVAWIEARL